MNNNLKDYHDDYDNFDYRSYYDNFYKATRNASGELENVVFFYDYK